MTSSTYDSWHRARPIDSGDETPWHRMVLARFGPDGASVRGARLLEIGCGRGGFALRMAAMRPALHVAADFSREAIAIGSRRAEELGVETIRWECHDIQNIGLADSSFDVVVSCETIEHVEHPHRAIRELARVLAPGGTLFLTTPNYLGALGAYRVYLRLRGRQYAEEGQPINRWMWTPWTAWLVMLAGLRICEVDGVGHYAYVPGAPPRRIAFLDRARRLTKWTAVHSLLVATKPISPH